jgi:hypothetical protein
MLLLLSMACALNDALWTAVEANVALDDVRKGLRCTFRKKSRHGEAQITSFDDHQDPSTSSDVPLTWWEDDDTKDMDTISPIQNGLLHSFRSIFVQRKQSTSMGDSTSLSNREHVPHPLRTDLWEIRCHWRGRARRKRNDATNQVPNTNGCIYDRCIFYLEFDPTGYVRLVSNEALETASENFAQGTQCTDLAFVSFDASCIGTWKLGPSGLHVKVPFPVSGQTTATTPPIVNQQMHTMDMDFHVNPFGLQPKFTRGIIYADVASSNPVLRLLHLRPIVATFTGVGVGIDTVDLSYRKRS